MLRKYLVFTVLLALIYSCGPKKENIEAKKRLMSAQEINPYDPPVKSLNVKLSELTNNNMQQLGKVLESPYRYTAKKIKAHKSHTYAEISFSRVNKVKIPDYKPVVPKQDEGASDRELPPKVNNFLKLSEDIYVEYSPKGNFSVKIKNSMGFEKEIRWINRILFIKNNSDNYTTRKSIDNEHLKTINEPSILFQKILEMISYKVKLTFQKEDKYSSRKVLVFKFEKSDKPYKKIKENSSQIKLLEGKIYIDKETFSPLFIDLKIKWQFKSKFKNKKTGKNELVDASFIMKREITQIGNNEIDIKTPKQEKILNVKIPPSESDAEEKILNFKKGHSIIDKLRKEKEKRDKLLGITKKK